MRLKGVPSRPRSILVVDDEELVVKFVERALREAGYQTATAPDGPEALEAAAKLETFDMVVTDLMMPKMTGDELARRLRLLSPGVKVLYLTGFSGRLFDLGPDTCGDEAMLEKPSSAPTPTRGASPRATTSSASTTRRRFFTRARWKCNAGSSARIIPTSR